MNGSYIPRADGAFRSWLDQFVTVAISNAATLHLDAAQILQLATMNADWDNALQQVVELRNLTQSATLSKNRTRQSIESYVRQLVQSIQQNPTVSDRLRKELGVSVRRMERTQVKPVAPADLVAHGFETGINRLKWNGNGNKKETLYVIEARYNETDTWELVDVTTRVRYDHHGQTPGVRMFYRVRARRPKFISEPSNVAVVYDKPTHRLIREAV